jgi:phenylacetate-CoA ligase
MSPPESLPTRLRWAAYLAAQVPRQRRLPFRPPVAIEREQTRNVRAMVSHAYAHVPHYREAMDRLGLRPTDFRGAADLGRLPPVDRGDLQRDPERFVSDAHPLDAYLKVRSGGSSGRPVTVYRHPFASFQAAAHRERRLGVAMKLAGRRSRVRQLRIASPVRTQTLSEGFRAGRLIPLSVRVVERHLSLLDPPAEAVRAINDFKPHLVHSYGSYVEALFLHLHRSGEEFHRPSAVLYGSDALSDAGRRLITETFGIPVLSGYGAIEAAPIAFECEEHVGFHLNADLFPVRVLDDDGREVPDGERGAVTVSNLVNEGTILLNYRLGDVASKLPVGCACGRSLPLLSFLEGRTDDWLESSSGERIHPQAVRTLFTDEEQVLRYQVQQRSPSRYAVAVVPAEGSDLDRLRARLVRKFADRLGAGTTIEVTFLDSLPRTEGGKVPTVVSMRRGASIAAPVPGEDA